MLIFVHSASSQWRGRVQHKEGVLANPQLPSEPCSEGECASCLMHFEPAWLEPSSDSSLMTSVLTTAALLILLGRYAVVLVLLPGSQACHTTPCASLDTGAHPMSLVVASLPLLLLLLLVASLTGRRLWQRMRGLYGLCGPAAEPLLPRSGMPPSLPASPASPSSQNSDPPSGRTRAARYSRPRSRPAGARAASHSRPRSRPAGCQLFQQMWLDFTLGCRA